MQSPRRQTELFEPAARPLPAGFVYRSDFITAEEERDLLAAIAALPLHEAQYKQFTAKRRVASFGAQYDFSGNVLQSAPPLPSFLLELRDKVAAWLDMPAAQFRMALIAEYRPGTPLGWHRDVPQFGMIAGISLAGRGRMRFRPYPPPANKREGVFALELEPRSIYVLQGDARWRWQHSIPPAKELRYSVTLRTMAGALATADVSHSPHPSL